MLYFPFESPEFSVFQKLYPMNPKPLKFKTYFRKFNWGYRFDLTSTIADGVTSQVEYDAMIIDILHTNRNHWCIENSC